jgi:hypothetical protein
MERSRRFFRSWRGLALLFALALALTVGFSLYHGLK